jgi:uncharacterized protein YaaW (UPF0174 family)
VEEFRAALELATEEELYEITELLFRPKFNPLDYLSTPSPQDVASQDREVWIRALEQRFRFLAADGLTVLRGRSQEIDYRQVLIQTCRHLKIRYSRQTDTLDLENEIFLHLMERLWQQLPQADGKLLQEQVQKALTASPEYQQLPAALRQEPIQVLLKGSSVLAVNSLLRPLLVQALNRQLATQFLRYQLARQALLQGGTAVTQVQGHLALQTAGRAIALNSVRLGAVRSVFAVIGPALWAWFMADLGWRAIATNYARVIPVIYTLAQIRLLRGDLCEWL